MIFCAVARSRSRLRQLRPAAAATARLAVASGAGATAWRWIRRSAGEWSASTASSVSRALRLRRLRLDQRNRFPSPVSAAIQALPARASGVGFFASIGEKARLGGGHGRFGRLRRLGGCGFASLPAVGFGGRPSLPSAALVVLRGLERGAASESTTLRQQRRTSPRFA